jgi:LPXTG-motif cell wall-anchored protein
VAIAVGALVAMAAPAAAHTVAVEGVTSCPDANHLVTWTLQDHYTTAGRTMTITSASATINGQTYAVTGYDATLPPGGTTQATTTVPGDVTGTITLTLRATWSDGYKGKASGSVVLQEPCVETTTTTASTTTTSTSQPSTSTTPTSSASTTSSTPVTGGTTPTSAAPPSSGVLDTSAGVTSAAGAANGTLPHTGEDSQPWAFAGVGAFVLGLVLLTLTSKRTRPGYTQR